MTAVSIISRVFPISRENTEGDVNGNSSLSDDDRTGYFNTFRYLPHAVAVGVGFVTVAAAWKNQQIQKKRKRLEQYRALHGGQLWRGFW